MTINPSASSARLPEITVALATSDHLSEAVGAILAELDLAWAAAAAPFIGLLRGHSSRRDPLQPAAQRVLIRRLATIALTVPVRVVPRPKARAILPLGGERAAWVEIDLGERGERFDRVELPPTLVEAGAHCLVTALPGPSGHPDDRPIAALASYTNPRQAFAARFDRSEKPGSQAELAAPIACRLILLVGQHRGDGVRRLALATPDLIAAELCWLALREDAPEQLGPWQEPTVQRATELDLGARLPAQLRLLVPPTAAPDPAATALVERLRLRLGIP